MQLLKVISETAGTIFRIERKVGDTVAEGEVILILESMKMEIPVEAPVSGKLSELKVAPEDQVEEDQIVAVIEV